MSAGLLLRGFRGLGARYASFSNARPHLAAGMTASGVLASADITCQLTLQRDEKGGIDWQRVAGLGVFGALHYGGPAKFLYLWYDRVLGSAPTVRTAMLKMGFDGARRAGSNQLCESRRSHAHAATEACNSTSSPRAQCTSTAPCCSCPTII